MFPDSFGHPDVISFRQNDTVKFRETSRKDDKEQQPARSTMLTWRPPDNSFEKFWWNLKVGHKSGAKRRKKIFVVPLHFFASQVQLVVLVGAFVMVSTIWSVSRLLFFYPRSPPPSAKPIVKVGARAPVLYGVGGHWLNLGTWMCWRRQGDDIGIAFSYQWLIMQINV